MRRDERLAGILEKLSAHGSIAVNDIAETFDVSIATARRDLDVLAERRLVSRTHGGASALSVDFELPARYRRDAMAVQKGRIAAVVAERLVQPGQSVGLSGGSTATAVAVELGRRESFVERGLTLVTNAINIAQDLVIRPHIRVVVTGGALHRGSYEASGPFSDLILERVTLDVALIGVNGFDLAAGPTVTDEREARVNAHMATRATRAWIVADSSKIGVRSFATVGSPRIFHGIVTDEGVTAEQVDAIRELGYEVVIA
ncbi:DeoR/GlpR transcriptional regulator [Pseudoclavibacter chungangensis]|uniref:DeoR/GlpR transcriptional regulator n=1 Tax=Pseudoclavibacter chungangensis TaxID=587635 RepID=A0A7J5BRL7_9MICO|nr:DeoR/GlpR family DNA-binding transcription regulator [Pseudoclavibacter chungangensis]KAB1654802.1 DeoR/GlpR transcriptional regulator [Pseudoclavibacter chungangensis]NYJ68082.1 DeoR family transcriptional regulator of aga operon [Pseudoclavibacter chungangensis]